MQLGRVERRVFGAAFAAVLLASCASYHRYRFGPNPSVVELAPDGEESPFATVAVSCLGIDRTASEPSRVAVGFRVRVENRGAEALHVDPGELRALDAGLEQLSDAIVDFDGATWSVGPGSAGSFEAWFGLPGDDPARSDLEGLDLRLALRRDEEVYTFHVRFERLHVVYHDPFFHDCRPWYPHPYHPHHHPRASFGVRLQGGVGR